MLCCYNKNSANSHSTCLKKAKIEKKFTFILVEVEPRSVLSHEVNVFFHYHFIYLILLIEKFIFFGRFPHYIISNQILVLIYIRRPWRLIVFLVFILVFVEIVHCKPYFGVPVGWITIIWRNRVERGQYWIIRFINKVFAIKAIAKGYVILYILFILILCWSNILLLLLQQLLLLLH